MKSGRNCAKIASRGFSSMSTEIREGSLLHGILKKTRATPASDLDLARLNKRKHEKALE